MNRDWQAFVIKVAAILSATPRWVGALLSSEGFGLPSQWLTWWIPLSAFLSIAMAVVEGWALAYVFNAWKSDRNNQLLVAALISCLTFVVVLTPYVVSNVTGLQLNAILNMGWLWVWAASVGLATMSIVISVGLAERRLVVTKEEKSKPTYGVVEVEGGYQASCKCGWVGDKVYRSLGFAKTALTNHKKSCTLS